MYKSGWIWFSTQQGKLFLTFLSILSSLAEKPVIDLWQWKQQALGKRWRQIVSWFLVSSSWYAAPDFRPIISFQNNHNNKDHCNTSLLLKFPIESWGFWALQNQKDGLGGGEVSSYTLNLFFFLSLIDG